MKVITRRLLVSRKQIGPNQIILGGALSDHSYICVLIYVYLNNGDKVCWFFQNILY